MKKQKYKRFKHHKDLLAHWLRGLKNRKRQLHEEILEYHQKHRWLDYVKHRLLRGVGE